jgi:hypothetical protein
MACVSLRTAMHGADVEIRENDDKKKVTTKPRNKHQFQGNLVRPET